MPTAGQTPQPEHSCRVLAHPAQLAACEPINFIFYVYHLGLLKQEQVEGGHGRSADGTVGADLFVFLIGLLSDPIHCGCVELSGCCCARLRLFGFGSSSAVVHGAISGADLVGREAPSPHSAHFAAQ